LDSVTSVYDDIMHHTGCIQICKVMEFKNQNLHAPKVMEWGPSPGKLWKTNQMVYWLVYMFLAFFKYIFIVYTQTWFSIGQLHSHQI